MEQITSFNSRDTIKSKKTRHSTAYNKLVSSILERDNWTCQRCLIGKFNTLKVPKLEVHHIKPFRFFPELRLDKDNCITLCAKCHKKVESITEKERQL